MGSISNVRAKDYETKLVCVCLMIFIILIKTPFEYLLMDNMMHIFSLLQAKDLGKVWK